ncbi:hypothetical protein ACWGDT_10900 [Streptomyces avermitilis]
MLVRSRAGGDLAGFFPEIAAAAADLPDDTALDRELVVWEHDRLAFERLQQRQHRGSAAAARAAAQWPAHFVAFDLLRLSTGRTGQPYVFGRVWAVETSSPACADSSGLHA